MGGVQSFGARREMPDQVLPQEAELTTVAPMDGGRISVTVQLGLEPGHLENIARVVHDTIAAAVRCGVECGLSDSALNVEPDLSAEPKTVPVAFDLDAGGELGGLLSKQQQQTM